MLGTTVIWKNKVELQFSSVAQSCPTLCNPMNRSTSGLPVHHSLSVHQNLPESTQTHVHHVGDAIQPSNPLVVPFSSCPYSFPASGSFQMSQLFASGGQSTGISDATSVLPMNTQHGDDQIGIQNRLEGKICWLEKTTTTIIMNSLVSSFNFFHKGGIIIILILQGKKLKHERLRN